MTEQTDKCKKRFKGIENFLRRVAFNLGNTPSQTEVKIISCIPIDVTDLQQKIINLEKQLEEDKTKAQNAGTAAAEQSKKKRQASVNTAIGTPSFSGTPRTVISCKRFDYDTPQMYAEDTNPRRSLDRYIFPNYLYSKEHITLSREQINVPEMDEDFYNGQNKGRMKSDKKNTPSNKKKLNTQFVYYTHTDGNPFNKQNLYLKPVPDNEMLSRSYLTNMIRKQYKPTFIDDFSDFSQFNAPICRDTDTNYKLHSYESDMCSCCHGEFHNIDTHITNKKYVPSPLVPSTIKESYNRNAYYDSSLYDLVPVREKSCKTNREPEIKRKKKNKRQGRTKHCLDYVRTNSGIHPLIVNYHTMNANYLKKKQMKVHHRRDVTTNRARKQRYKNSLNRETSIDTSKSCSLDLGNIYIKAAKNESHISKKMKPIHKNAECLTKSITMVECQTATSNSIELTPTPREDKTEVTLDQIKTILQSVLSEVKANNLTKDATQENDKKDAVAQKGISQINMQDESSILNSFTYSPYNMNPYIASCSRNLPPNPYIYNGYNGSLHPKYFQNYPVFIQTPGRHVCTSCYRNSSHVAKSVRPKYATAATTAATNTGEKCEERSKETEKLIKEIYKSMALSMDLAAKDASLSENDDQKSIIRIPMTKSVNTSNHFKVVEEPAHFSGQIRKKDNQVSQFANINDDFDSNTLSTLASRQSRQTTTFTDVTNPRARKSVIEKYINTRKNPIQSTETEDEEDLQHPSTMTSISEDETETSGSETDSDEAYMMVKDAEDKKEKKGLFSKFKSVFKSKEKNKKPEKVVEESESSDTDDYQTIYSHNVERAPSRRVPHTPHKIKPYSKVLHSKKKERHPEKLKGTYAPNMEQEYWNEKSHQNRKRRLIEQPYSKETNSRFMPYPEYYRNYVDRNVLVDPRREMYHPKIGASINARRN